MYVDLDAWKRRAASKFHLVTFYGQLLNIYLIQFPKAVASLHLNHLTTIILAAIKSCSLIDTEAVHELDIHYYKDHGRVHVIDITSIQSLVGWVPDRGGWAIIDRSGNLACAQFRTQY